LHSRLAVKRKLFGLATSNELWDPHVDRSIP
jgi:hypothetical protein